MIILGELWISAGVAFPSAKGYVISPRVADLAPRPCSKCDSARSQDT